jgi:uncharacterized protein
MKQILAAVSVALAFAAAPVSAQTAPAAPAPAADPASAAAAHRLFEAMNYRVVAQGMLNQMTQSLPAAMRQGAEAAIDSNRKLSEEQKRAAVAKLDRDLPQVVAAIQGIFSDPATVDEMLRETEQLYARHFTAAELDQIAAFYRTPVGAKMLASMPQLMNESMQIGQRVVMPRVAGLMEKLGKGD